MDSMSVVTLVTRNYIHYAHALALSIKQNAPGTPVIVCIADDPGPAFRAPPEWDHWFLAADLNIPRWRRFAFQYTPFELSCALKPFVMQHVLDLGHPRLAYLDGDMQVYSPMYELRQWLASASIVLTPHARFSKMDPLSDFENLFLIAGAYNAGFFAVSDSPDARKFLQWWQAKVTKFGIHDLPGGLFVDQKWLDLVPGMFDDVMIAKHCGYNLGHWILGYTPDVQSSGGQVTINGDPLSIFHYSGFLPEFPELISHHEGSTVARFPALAPLCQQYAERLRACGLADYPKLGCEFARLTDGTEVDPLWREIIRAEHAQLAAVEDPFDVQATDGLVEKYKRLAPSFVNSRKIWRLKNAKRPGSLSGKPNRLRAIGKQLENALRSLRKRVKAAHARVRLAAQPSTVRSESPPPSPSLTVDTQRKRAA